jgi:2-dehydro-3-deoxyphosphooctonate aldolase (KDO 8-P synthase)
MNPVQLGNITLGGANAPLFVIAGPCVIENESLCRQVAETMAGICADLHLPYIFKASFDKANRTATDSFRGPGLKDGLAILDKIKKSLGLPVLTDIHETAQCQPAAEVCDILQIPAFLCRQTDLIQAAAKTGRCVNIKKGQFLAPWDMRNAVEKVTAAGGKSVLLTERGTTFGYGNLVTDMRSVPLMRELGWPVVFDATHSVQMPGGGPTGKVTGGDRRMAPVLARAAVAAGCDGVFFETHPDPDKAKSDAANQISLAQMKEVLAVLRDIHTAVAPAYR